MLTINKNYYVILYIKYKMSIFQEVLTDVKGVEEKYLGKPYDYAKNIRTPSELGMSSEGSLSALGKDIQGLTHLSLFLSITLQFT